MIARLLIALAGPSLSACFITIHAPADGSRSYPLRAIEVQVFQRDDEGAYRPYTRPVRYEAEFACHSRGGFDELLRREPGNASSGRFSLPYPSDCGDESALNLAIMPGFQHCQAGRIHRDQLRVVEGGSALDVTIQCDSLMRIAKLQALPLLGCHERATTIERTATGSFRVTGCGRSIELWCQAAEASRDVACEHGAVY